MAIAGIAAMAWKISATILRLPDIPWMEAMPNMPWCARTLHFRCPQAWTTYMLLRCCALASSGFAACGLRGLSPASELDFLALAAPQAWQLPFCNHGNAKCML